VVNFASVRFAIGLASGVHNFRPASMLLDSCFCFCRNLTLGFFISYRSWSIDGAGSSIFAVSIGGDMKRPVCSIGKHLKNQNFCPRAGKIRAIVDTHQDIIGHDALVMSWILPNHNEHGAFEGHRKEDVTSKVSDPLFTKLVQRSDSNEKSMLIRCLSGGGASH